MIQETLRHKSKAYNLSLYNQRWDTKLTEPFKTGIYQGEWGQQCPHLNHMGVQYNEKKKQWERVIAPWDMHHPNGEKKTTMSIDELNIIFYPEEGDHNFDHFKEQIDQENERLEKIYGQKLGEPFKK